jgi:hypothetical protein
MRMNLARIFLNDQKMTVSQTPSLARTVKKLNKNQKEDMDITIRSLMKHPESGELKKSDLSGARVLKFKMNKQISFLAYIYDEGIITLTLLTLGKDENFYRDIK